MSQIGETHQGCFIENPHNKWLKPSNAFGGISAMAALFNRLDSIYPIKWRSNFRGADSDNGKKIINDWALEWADAFVAERITYAHVKAGLIACRTSQDWPPSCAEFIRMCKPPINNLDAYHEAVSGVMAREVGSDYEWSHPAIFWAATSLYFDLKTQTYAQVKDRWERALKMQLEREYWEEIPRPRISLPEPSKKTINPAKVAEMVEEFERAFTHDDDRDHKKWARKIMERVNAGDKNVTLIQKSFASEALNNVLS